MAILYLFTMSVIVANKGHIGCLDSIIKHDHFYLVKIDITNKMIENLNLQIGSDTRTHI